MYERFTDRARKVIQLANAEAQRFNHDYINTEHILLGLVREGSGVAANVLKNLNVDLTQVRDEIQKRINAGSSLVQGKLPQSGLVKQLLMKSMEEAKTLNHNYVGTEHLLLGLVSIEEGVAAEVLIGSGLKLEDVRREVLNLLEQGLGEEGSHFQPTTVADFKWYLRAVISQLHRDVKDSLKSKQLTPELFAQAPRLIKEAVDEVFGGQAEK